MYGKSRYLSHFKVFYYTFTVFEWQMNMKIKQGKKYPDQSFLQSAVFFKNTRNSIFFSVASYKKKLLNNKMCNAIPQQLNAFAAFNTKENNFQTIPRSYCTK
jgi:hypothetical protein